MLSTKDPRTMKTIHKSHRKKNSHSKTLYDAGPAALTLLVMKSFEKLIKKELLDRTEHHLNPWQFAYRACRVQDATITLLKVICKHIEGRKNHARLVHGLLISF